MYTCACIILGILFSLGEYCNAQQNRRPGSTSAGMDAYRMRLAAYNRRQSTPKPAPLQTPSAGPSRAGQQAQIVNGFYCAKIHTFFTTEDNPRMYHLCARNRDSWYVYHFFCPGGSIFDESVKKCSMSRRAPPSRPFIVSTPGTSTTTTRTPVIQRRTTTMSTRGPPPNTGFASFLGLNGFFPRPPSTTMASTMMTTTTTTTAEIPEAVPEPEPNATDISASSEESTEEETMGVKNVYVNIPGFTMSSSSSAHPPPADDGNEEATTEIDTPNEEESNMIPESGTTLQNSLAYQLQQVASMHNKTNPSKTMEMVASILKASALSSSGGRRPRVKKQNKWHYYRFLN
ncbi:hypothetical protein Ocin01_11150 [Orchesella cincta]|uniref:Chitin-binding type-2 domain-containing protein n=1 Tax=Orchesella cincta TaxID=48709 RepID=A0A1D2MRL7_ORCCI|nr:hypothetical protein Ocin01_11150 [Orchesella cincta]